MSLIDEPPGERYPIETYVVEFNELMIREAILKEIERGGQVYFVYNRVEDIDKIAAMLKISSRGKYSHWSWTDERKGTGKCYGGFYK